MRLSGKRALVTGAGGGIGSALASGLSREGAAVVVHARSDGSAELVCQEIRRTGGTAFPVVGDVRTDAAGIVRAAAQALDGLDVLVNNAGVMSTAPFLELTEEEWRRVIDTNLTGYFLVGQSAARIMADRGSGAIVNVSSTRQVQSWPGSTAYTSSKGGIAALTRQMALELAPHGVRVNSIAPGTFVTNLNREYALDADFRRQREAAIPLGRYGETEELVGAVNFLVSDDASFVVGASLMIDGGQALW